MIGSLDPVYSFWRDWFAQPDEAKRPLLRASGRGGWYPPFSEAPGYGKPDPKEYFHFRWPLHAELHPATADLFVRLYCRAQDWLSARGLIPALSFPPELCVLRILHYLPTPDGIVGEAHRDFDLLTVSVPGTCPGLEVWESGMESTCTDIACEGHWVPQEYGVQVGEMLEHYTGLCGSAGGSARTLNATPHRVRTAPNTERFKAVFFYLCPNDFELRPGFTAGDYLKGVLTKAGTINVGAPAPGAKS